MVMNTALLFDVDWEFVDGAANRILADQIMAATNSETRALIILINLRSFRYPIIRKI